MNICFQIPPASSWAILFSLIAWSSSAARAELIVDDFDDPAEVVTPAMIDQFVETPGVGDLNARRSIRIFSSQAEPVGRIDVNARGSSSFLAVIGELNSRNSSLSTIVSVQSNYDFTVPGAPMNGRDVSEGGWNNAIIFDFRELSAAIVPSFFHVIVQDATDSYETPFVPPILGDRPFSIVMPFDSFRFRGGGAGLPDFTTIRSLNVSMRVVSGAGPEDLAFRMDLDRIRFSRIPEPAGEALIVLGLAVVGCMRRASRRLI